MAEEIDFKELQSKVSNLEVTKKYFIGALVDRDENEKGMWGEADNFKKVVILNSRHEMNDLKIVYVPKDYKPLKLEHNGEQFVVCDYDAVILTEKE